METVEQAYPGASMQSSSPTDLQNDLRDLSESIFPSTRRRAAYRLGQLTTTNDEVVRALVGAQTLDTDVDVRMAAGEALQSPIHQAFLQTHPGFAREAVDRMSQVRKQEREHRRAQITGEFLQLRSRERSRSLVLACFMILPWCLVSFLPYEWGLIILRSLPVAVIAGIGLRFWLSWRDWRCPSCDGWLNSRGAAIHPFFSSAPLRCPHCGVQLL